MAVPPAVAAHEGDPRLILEPPTVAPGGGVRVIGEDLEPGLQVRVTIESLDAGFAAADLVVDPAGHFTHEVALPPGVTSGVYGVKAEAAGDLVASDVLVVDDRAGPGIPIERPSPWLPIGALAVGVLVLLGALRLRGRRGFGATTGSRPTRKT